MFAEDAVVGNGTVAIGIGKNPVAGIS